MSEFERRPGPKPEGKWVHRLAAGDAIYLCKDNVFAFVRMPYQRPRPGHCAGQLCLSKIHNNCVGGTEVWYINEDGAGFDGKQLILPCEGWLPKTLEDLNPGEIDQLLLAVRHLQADVDMLKRKVLSLELLSKVSAESANISLLAAINASFGNN